MRRFQKQQIEAFIHLLEEAHSSVRKALRSGEREAALSLLAQCQEGAVSAGTLIESVEGEGSPAVALLEDYCEQVYQCSEAVRREDAAMSGSRIYKALGRSLSDVRKSVREGLRVRTEVVFFPYKASMWDSLESVWRAADADPDCDAYVVPIPYYDKNADGSLGQMRYEGNCYPSWVPVVDWRTYDLEKRRPDAAFIHNPYDGQNLVTQVHETYFSENLKKHVGLLCYIPYFVAALGASPHFAYMPAVVNSDLTIVETEKIRQDYLSVWKRLAQQGQVSPADAERMASRILALGSPKYDAASNTRREDFAPPEEWKRLIDSAGGPVVFYNTSIGEMLQSTVDVKGEDRYLKKIKSVLRYFKQRGDAVLLWRPHPLIEQTLASMRPQLYEEYRGIVREYKEAGYGIYDDSADLYRAMSIADAYYGDSSSVIYLWEKTGKPLLLDHVDITDYRHRLVVRNLYFDGSCFWCTALDFNGLFQIDRDALECRYVGQFPGEKPEGCELFGMAAECGSKLYFAPWTAEHIGLYDKRTGEFSPLPIPQARELQQAAFKYYAALAYQDFVYLIGNQVNAVLRIDARTDEVTVMDGWRHELEAHESEKEESFFSYACQDGPSAYLFSKYANAMLRLDLTDGQWKLIRFPGRNRKYAFGICEGNKVWFCSESEGAVGFYNAVSEELVELDAPDLFAQGFSSMQIWQDDVDCFSRNHEYVLRISRATHQMQVYRSLENCETSTKAGKYAYVTSKFTGRLQRLNLETMESRVEDLLCGEMPEAQSSAVLEASRSCKEFALEDAYLNLDTLVEAARSASPDSGGRPSRSGETIYQYIKKVIS